MSLVFIVSSLWFACRYIMCLYSCSLWWLYNADSLTWWWPWILWHYHCSIARRGIEIIFIYNLPRLCATSVNSWTLMVSGNFSKLSFIIFNELTEKCLWVFYHTFGLLGSRFQKIQVSNQIHNEVCNLCRSHRATFQLEYNPTGPLPESNGFSWFQLKVVATCNEV